jgi:acyl-CoA hydrolase
MDRNRAVASYPADYTNHPQVIARHDNVVSITNAIEVDLYGQVAAESLGPRQISGNGGMLDFVYGALRRLLSTLSSSFRPLCA